VSRGLRHKAEFVVPRFFLDFVRKGTERSRKTKRNIFFSFFIKGFNILLSLILVPLTINFVDQTQYGIWLTLSSIVSWFGFFDIGFGNGLRNKLSEALAHGKYRLARIYISTTYAILAGISVSVFLIYCLFGAYIDWTVVLNTPQSMKSELSKVAFAAVSFFCLHFVLQTLTVILNANQQPARAALLNFVANLVTLVFVFLLIISVPGNLFYLSVATGIAPVLVMSFASLIYFSRSYSKFKPALKMVRLKFGKQLMDLGIKFFVIQIAVIILYQTSNIIIAQLYDPSEVTPYNIVYKYFAVIPLVFNIIITPFWSAFTDAWVKRDIAWIENMMKKLRFSWLVLLAGIILMVICSTSVYRLWIGPEVVISFSLTITMALYVTINLWNAIYSQFLNGAGIIRLQLLVAVVGSVINVPLSIYLCRKLGIHGVVLSTSIVSILGTILYPIQYRKIIRESAIGIWSK
jgi:O-antigen/teichoic acid export membrane protein